MPTLDLSTPPDAIAPDGAEVRLLATGRHGSMAHFLLPAGTVARPVRHPCVEELWFCLRGAGEIVVGDDAPVALSAGVSVRIPSGTRFQWRAGFDGPLEIIGATMPPWQDGDAEPAEPYWT